MWDASCKEGDLGCLADGKHLGCRWCGFEQYENVTCPRDTCTFDNEPVTPYYWDSLCEMGMLGCNADGIHVQCRFCDHQPFNGVHCPPSARPNYPDGDCWFPVGTAQSHKWDKNCKWGILGASGAKLGRPLGARSKTRSKFPTKKYKTEVQARKAMTLMCGCWALQGPAQLASNAEAVCSAFHKVELKCYDRG